MLIYAQVIGNRAAAVCSSGFLRFSDSSLGWILKKVVVAVITCIFAIGGAVIGVITGALKGQTTETGILRGVGVGAMTGAITGVQLVELILNGEPFSKIGLICSLINGKIFMEWVSPAILKAYQWQVGAMDINTNEVSDLFEGYPLSGLPQETIRSLPCFTFTQALRSDSSCAICLQDLHEGESGRLMPSCRHFFHQQCVDVWLSRQGSCPLCRRDCV